MKTVDKTQILVLNQSGQILHSNDTLFSTATLRNQSVLDWSPFLESIFPFLLKSTQKTYEFVKVKTIHNFLSGSYDYLFIKSEKSNLEKYIVWIISDCSSCYEEMKKRQQLYQQFIIDHQLSLLS